MIINCPACKIPIQLDAVITKALDAEAEGDSTLFINLRGTAPWRRFAVPVPPTAGGEF
jgi:hypothetical protein